MDPRAIEDLLRECAPQVLGAVVRRYGDFATCEDAVQEALLAAAQPGPGEGGPAHPKNLRIPGAAPPAGARGAAAGAGGGAGGGRCPAAAGSSRRRCPKWTSR